MIDFEILPELIGQNVILRLPQKNEENALQLYDIITASRSVFEKWMPWAHKVQTLEDCYRFLEYTEKEVAQCEKLNYLIFEKENNSFCGLICLYDYNSLHKRGEWGIWLDVRKHGRSLAYDAYKIFEDFLFASGVHRLEIHCEAENMRSIALAHRTGFQDIALLKDYRYSTDLKRFCDTLYLYKLAPNQC